MCALLAVCAASAQTPTFEAATVKAADPTAPNGVDFRLTPGRLTAVAVTLEQLVSQAYAMNRIQITGGPSWFKTDRFDINATAEGNLTREQMMLMLQTLLHDRFQLKIHRESREGKVHTLVVAKNGPKLERATQADERGFIRILRYDPPERPSLTYAYVGQGSTIVRLVSLLKGQLGTPAVTDGTHLEGAFNFRLEFAPDDPQSAGPSLYSALQEQLGLKLESAKGSIEMLIIDHAERPAEN